MDIKEILKERIRDLDKASGVGGRCVVADSIARLASALAALKQAEAIDSFAKSFDNKRFS